MWSAAAVPPSLGVVIPAVRWLFALSLAAAHVFMYVFIAVATDIHRLALALAYINRLVAADFTQSPV